MAKEIINKTPMRRRKVGRSRFILIGGVQDNIRILKITNWWMVARTKEPEGIY